MSAPAVKSGIGTGTVKSKDKKNKKKKFCKEDIGTPTDFRHVGHVGWNPEKGHLDVSLLSVEWLLQYSSDIHDLS